MLAGGLVNTFAVNPGMWIAGRVIAGMGVGIVKVGAPVLIQEISHPRLRPTLGSCYQAFAYIGQFFAGWMTCEHFCHSQPADSQLLVYTLLETGLGGGRPCCKLRDPYLS